MIERSLRSEESSVGRSCPVRFIALPASFGLENDRGFLLVISQGIWDCPNEVAALKLSGSAVSSGDLQVQTLPACRVEDFFQAMSVLPR